MIAIVDYGLGNVASVKKALDFLGISSELTKDRNEISSADGVILPGVGAFPYAMKRLESDGMVDFLRKTAKKKPFLGICLGMQLLFDRGYEIEETDGLGLISGEVRKIPDMGLKIPHMGWNSLVFSGSCSLLNGVSEGDYVYYVHSYRAELKYRENLAAYSEYGTCIAGVVQNGNVFGTQFHPEKSGDVGLRILKNFGEMCR